MPAMKVILILKLFDDASTRKKLEVMDAWDAMLDDERNKIPKKYNELISSLRFGDKVKVTFECTRRKL